MQPQTITELHLTVTDVFSKFNQINYLKKKGIDGKKNPTLTSETIVEISVTHASPHQPGDGC